ncbi:MAG: bifunctional 5,10-methylenetetrahydrofolate dehydrogenase/5,10-methenyltetrahydrofolate cyclohydrolase [Helicobacter sp.]|nr:bifunctional 5,10-methylenetetrahydrofolate dehydrogenase/5,10-methenyltetrahydrofolate cyclohydrolase [Helicobacter sp.]
MTVAPKNPATSRISESGPKILDGKKLAQNIELDLKLKVLELQKRGIFPTLAVILIGNDPNSHTYVNMKIKASHRCGIKTLKIEKNSITQADLERKIDELNADKNIHGILIQLPLPDPLNAQKILEKISPNKDVDGFHPYNIGRMQVGLDALVSATPLGVIALLKHYKIKIKGQNVTIVGASNIIGKPLLALFLHEGATPSICHIHTKDLSLFTLQADILCVGVGVANLIKPEMIKPQTVIIDIGNNRLKDGRLVGDVSEKAYEKSSFYTPVPGGVGPMTISCLLQNLIKIASKDPQ